MSKRLAICTSSARSALAISEALREAGIPFILLDPSSPSVDEADVIVTTEEEVERLGRLGRAKVIEAGSSKVSTVAKAILAIQEKTKFKELLVGVDPGRSYGLAFIADSAVIGLSVHGKAEEVVKEIEEVVGTGLFEKVVVKVGSGSPEHRDRVLSLIRERLGEVEVRLVNEEGSPLLPPFIKKVPKDAASAFYLALKH